MAIIFLLSERRSSLNPVFDDANAVPAGIHGEDTCYLDGFVDASFPVCYRGTGGSPPFFHNPPGIDAESVNRNVPLYEEGPGGF